MKTRFAAAHQPNFNPQATKILQKHIDLFFFWSHNENKNRTNAVIVPRMGT